MGGVCRARNCFRSKDKCPDLPFFTFPKNPISAKKWITNIGDPELLKRPPSALKNNVVCALHFEEKCFVNKKKRSLMRNAVPTIFNIPPFRSQESHKNDKHSKSGGTDVPECNSGAVFSCNVETFDNWHHQIDAVTEQLLSLLPENSTHTLQLQPQAEKRCVDAYTQYENESCTHDENQSCTQDENESNAQDENETESREFENRLNDLNKDTIIGSSDAVPRVQLLCRLCSKLTHRECVTAIFSYEGEKIHLELMINSIMPTKVIQDDGLPQQVCKLCVRKLTFCHDVRKEFLASEKRLRDLLGIAAPKDAAEIPGTKENVEERSAALESPSGNVIASPAENTTKVQLKENDPPSVALQTEETTITQSEILNRGSKKRKRVTTGVKNNNPRKKDNKIPKLTKSGTREKKATAEDTPKLIKSAPQGKKTIAENTPKLKPTPQGKKTIADDVPLLINSTNGKKAAADASPKLMKSAPYGKKAAAEESPKLMKPAPHGKKATAEESPRLIKPAPHGKKATAEESPKLIKLALSGKKSTVEESPKLIKSAPHGKKAVAQESPKLIKAGPQGKNTTGEEILKLIKTSPVVKIATTEEISNLVLAGPHGKHTTTEEISKLVTAVPHGEKTTVEEIPTLVKIGHHGTIATVEEIPNLLKTGPHDKKTTAEESDFENDSNYEIHWYDEAYDDSISEDMGTSDSILNNKKMFVNSTKKQLTSEAAKLVTDPVADEETKNIKDNNVTTLNHKKLNESKVDDSILEDNHLNDSNVNESSVNDSNVNESKVNTDISTPITNSHPSPKEGSLSSVSIRQKIGSGSVKVRLMTERQKLLKLKMKTQNKLLKQGSRKKVLPVKNSCPECKKSFSSKLKLERHIVMHSKFECAVCSTVFNTAEELSNHSRENCLSKLKATTDAAATGHECEICRRTFKTRQRLLLHSKTHSTIIMHSGVIPYTCKVCPKAFPTRIRLKQHLKIHKPEKSKNNKELFRHHVQHTESSLTLKCETCSTFFTSAKEYEKHREEHTSSSSTIHVNGASRAEITSGAHNVDKLASGSGGSIDTSSVMADIQCVELTKTVKEDGVMKVKVPHLEKNLIITSADQFVCDICDCKFSSKHFQEEHKKVHHSLPKQSSDVLATSSVESTVELLQTPERGKLYFCDQCGEGYERKRSLALHRFSHRSSHRCPHCHQSFSSEDSLTRHVENCVEVKEETAGGNNQL